MPPKSFAPFSPDTGELDPTVTTIGEHRFNLARRNIKAWLENVGIPYHSPHKFRHGGIQYGLNRSKSIADYKAVSMNAMHSSMEITDEFYSNLNDGEIRNRISSLGKDEKTETQDDLALLKEFLEWRKNRQS